MQTILDQPVFAVDREEYRWDDVLLAAMLWGDWQALEAEVRQGVACVKHAEARGSRPAAGAVDTAAKAFRYERELITAQETQAWLDRWGLSPDKWMSWVRRSVLRKECSTELSTIVSHHTVAQSEVDALILTDGICAGHLPRFARKLAEHAAAADAVKNPDATETGAASRVEETAERSGGRSSEHALDRVLAELAERDVPGHGTERRRERLTALLRLESEYTHFRVAVLTSRAIRDQIALHQLDWVRLDCRTLAFDDEGVAREAALCVREDGEELARVAAAANTSLSEVRFYLDELEGLLRERFLSARPGELLGPLHVKGVYVLYQVIEKHVPTPNDPDIRRRAEEGAMRSAVTREVDRRVRWRSNTSVPV